MAKETLDVLVQGGKATPAPPLGPSLAQLKVNVGEVVAQINEKTAAFAGMDVPVKVVVDTETKQVTISVGTPPVTSLLKKEMKVQKLARVVEGNRELPGSISMAKIIAIAKAKEIPGSMKARVKQIAGTCLSGGILIDNKSPKEVIKELDEGKYDDLFRS